jgi:hypothetical protein
MSARDLNNRLLVNRVLRHRASREYFRDGNWTSNPEEASTFSDALEAARVCVRHRLENVELALRFPSGASDVFCTPIR